MRDVALSGAQLPDYQLCPEKGGFFAYKVLKTKIIEIYIPKDAKRMSCLTSRKCRAEFVRAVSSGGTSSHGGEYRRGEIYYPDSYDDDIRVVCSHGVHFFLTRKEAVDWMHLMM